MSKATVKKVSLSGRDMAYTYRVMVDGECVQAFTRPSLAKAFAAGFNAIVNNEGKN